MLGLPDASAGALIRAAVVTTARILPTNPLRTCNMTKLFVAMDLNSNQLAKISRKCRYNVQRRLANKQFDQTL